MTRRENNIEKFRKHLKSIELSDKFIEKFIKIIDKDIQSIDGRIESLIESDHPQYEAIMHLISISGMLANFCATYNKILKKTYANEMMQLSNEMIQSLKDFLKHLENLELLMTEFSHTFFQYLRTEE